MIFSGNLLNAQSDRYFIQFKDKGNSEFSFNAPEEFLSQRSIDRRLNFGIAIDSLDLPVSKAYLDSLSKENITVYYKSKWLNGVVVQEAEATVNNLRDKIYIDTIIYIAPGFRLTTSKDNYPFGNSTVSISNPNNLNQNNQNNLINFNPDNVNQTGRGVRIAVLDGGFNNVDQLEIFSHLFQNGQIIDKYDFIENENNPYYHNNDHGTKVLSLISGLKENTYQGLAPDAEICLYVTEDYPFSNEFRIEEYNWVIAAERADSAGVDIITSSLGYTTFEDATMDYQTSDIGKNRSIASQGAKIAVSRGIFTVVSAGNSGQSSSWPYTSFPADEETVLTVGAVTPNGIKSNFSSIGHPDLNYIKPDIATPGSQVVLVGSSGTVTTSNGTSFSAPIATGMAALVLEKSPDLSPEDLLKSFHNAGTKSTAPDNQLGYGIPNLAIMLGEYLSVPDQNLNNGLLIYPNPSNPGNLTFQIFDTPTDNEVRTLIYSNSGSELINIFVKLQDGKGEIDLTGLSTGNYFIIVRTKKGDLKGKVILTDQ
ncbi:S8 family serine peptidase [Marinigracilibium pacificum]|nr:S8 family serine peptidase [Marinigracilibium pacificum]